jgi:hypothetical protein
MGGAGADGEGGVLDGVCGHGGPGQECNGQPGCDHRLDPVEAAPQRVVVRPQPADRPYGPRRNYC